MIKNIFDSLVSKVYAIDVIGTITLPSGVPQQVNKTTNFISSIIRFIVVIAGIFALWQLLTGGLQFITSGGDKGKITEAQHKMQMSLVGLVIIAGSFIIIALVSKLLFGNSGAILNPELTPVVSP